MAIAIDRSADGSRWARMVLLLPLVWWTLALATGRSSWCFIDYVNLAFHEAGHIFLSFAGTTLHYLGGSIGQVLVPALLCFYFLRRAQPFAASVCAWWIGESLINIGIYMADARDLTLPLVGGGDHDWNELLFRFGMLDQASVERVAGTTHIAGAAMMLLGLAWSAYFVLPADTRERFRSLATSRWPWLDSALDA